MFGLHVEQGDAEYRAVGGDEGEINAKNLVQLRAGLFDCHFCKLNNPGDDHDERKRGEVGEIGSEQVMLDQVAGAGTQRQHKGRGRTHADGGLKFLGHAHERAQPEYLHHHDVIHKHRTDKDE